MSKDKEKDKKKTMTGVIYARYSEGPNQTDQSIEGQVADCRAYAERTGIQILAVYADKHISGKSARNRPQFQQLMSDAEAHRFDCIIVWKIDRFGRSRQDIALCKYQLKKAGVALYYAAESVPQGPEGIILESVLEGVAEYYSAELSQKVQRGRRETVKRGLSYGTRPPIGYKIVDRHYVVDQATAPYVRHVFEMRAAGSSCVECADYLNSVGVRSFHGHEIEKGVIYRMLRNPRYLGIFDSDGIELRVDPIVSQELFDSVQASHPKTRNAGGRARAKEQFLLSCVCRCGHCGSLCIIDQGRGKSGKLYHYYVCNLRRRKGAHACKLGRIPQEKLEDLIISATVDDMLTGETITKLVDEVMRIQEEERQKSPLDALQHALSGNRAKQKNLADAIASGGASLSALLDKLRELEQEADTLESEIRQAQYEHPMIPREAIESWLQGFRQGDKDDPQFRQRLVDTFISRVDLFNDRAVIYYNMTEKKPSGDVPEGVRLRAVSWTTDTGSRTPTPFCLPGYIVLVVPIAA